jgi:hypothetical protein
MVATLTSVFIVLAAAVSTRITTLAEQLTESCGQPTMASSILWLALSGITYLTFWLESEAPYLML